MVAPDDAHGVGVVAVVQSDLLAWDLQRWACKDVYPFQRWVHCAASPHLDDHDDSTKTITTSTATAITIIHARAWQTVVVLGNPLEDAILLELALHVLGTLA
jgi:hypothetical protein